eukprot:3926205-Amphidinium_carterae.1
MDEVKCRGIQTLRIAGNRFGVLGATSLAEVAVIKAQPALAGILLNGFLAEAQGCCRYELGGARVL